VVAIGVTLLLAVHYGDLWMIAYKKRKQEQ